MNIMSRREFCSLAIGTLCLPQPRACGQPRSGKNPAKVVDKKELPTLYRGWACDNYSIDELLGVSVCSYRNGPEIGRVFEVNRSSTFQIGVLEAGDEVTPTFRDGHSDGTFHRQADRHAFRCISVRLTASGQYLAEKIMDRTARTLFIFIDDERNPRVSVTDYWDYAREIWVPIAPRLA